MCWLKDLVKIYQKLTFANNILLEFEKFGRWFQQSWFRQKVSPSLFQKVFKRITAGKVRDKNITFESDRTS